MEELDFSTLADFTGFEAPDEDYDILHYGVGHLDGGHSGRYAWGSGDNPMQRDEFMSTVNKLRKEGKTDLEIGESMGLNSTQFRTQYRLAKDLVSMEKRAEARKLRDEGLSLKAIAEKMGFKNDSSVRTLLDESTTERMEAAINAADFLKEQVDTKGAIDVGLGTEQGIGVAGISREKLKEALYILEMEGYPSYKGGVKQATNAKQQTNIWALCPPGTSYPDFYKLLESDGIHFIEDYTSQDGGDTFHKWEYPKSMDSSRLICTYKENGGAEKDGVAEIRPGVPDLYLGGARYSQVRILVDDKYYIKGMAVYGDPKDFPPGVDVIFNTSKSEAKGKLGVLKEVEKNLKKDPNNPFGSLIKSGINEPDEVNGPGGQSYYIDENGEKQLSLINKRASAGDWGEWGDALPSQMLAKQSLKLIKQQLKITEEGKEAEFKDILEIDNPVVRKQLLMSFADDCDSGALHLKAAALPRQKYEVILPLTTIGDDEIYAPNYKDGEKVALIRYPHEGIYQIPILTVNNRNKEGQRIFGKNSEEGALDVVGISSKTAEKLSGADFDGDTVTVIPTNDKINIRTQKTLDGLKNFDNRVEYAYSKEEIRMGELTAFINKAKKEKNKKGELKYPEYKDIVEAYNKDNGTNYSVDEFKQQEKIARKSGVQLMRNTQTEMGVISNLISDMTLLGAPPDELARATRHSMTVIDAEKHNLNYKKSYVENGIEELKQKWQIKVAPDGTESYGGAATLISRAKSQESVDKRQGSPKINIPGTSWYDPSRPEGALIYKKADDAEYFSKKTGKIVKRTQPSTKMAETDDAYTLISEARTPQEIEYAEFANKLKSLANQARKEAYYTKGMVYNASAAKEYAKEVDELKAALSNAEKNKPKERQAQLIVNKTLEEAEERNPNMSKGDLKKLAQKTLTEARAKVGAKGKESKITISDQQWKAIQAGAISGNMLSKIIADADKDRVRQLATPRASNELSPAKQARLKQLSKMNYTTAQIADFLGCSTSTVQKYTKEG